MDFYKKIANLKVMDNLFKDVKFYITGSLPDWILQMLVRGAAKQVSHISDFMTHLIVGSNPDANEIDEVKDIYDKPVVTHLWIIYSVKCDKLLPAEGFSPDNNQLFSGVKASVSKLGIDDSNIVWGLITFYGGKCTIDLDHTCTHLIVGKPDGIKYKRALEKTICIVTPDWVVDTINFSGRKNESCYHPKLLNLSIPSPMAYQKTPSERHIRKTKKEFTTSKACIVESIVPTSVRSSNILANTSAIVTTSSNSQSVSASFENTKVIDDSKMPNVPKPIFSEKSLFDSLIFSDDEEEGSDGEGKSLLDQLKNTQSWKHSPAPFISLPASSTVTQQLKTTTTSIPSLATTTSIENIPPVSITLKTHPSNDSAMFSQKEQLGKSTLPSVVNISAPSISITSQSASALLPSSLIGSLVTSSNSVGNKVVVTSSITSCSSIISTSEVDISFISKQNIHSTNSAPTTLLSQSIQPESATFSEQTSINTSTSTLTNNASRSEQLSAIYSGKPLTKTFGQSTSTVSQIRPLSTLSTAYSTLPPFSSTQPSSLAISSHQRQFTTQVSSTSYLSTNSGPTSTNSINRPLYTVGNTNNNRTTSPNVVLRNEVNKVLSFTPNVVIRSETPIINSSQNILSNIAGRTELSLSNSGQSTSPNIIRSEIQNQVAGHGTAPNISIRNDVPSESSNNLAPPNVVINNLSQVQQMGVPTPTGTPTSVPIVTDVTSSSVHPTLLQAQSVNQSPVPIQLIRQGSISIVGSQGQTGQQNVSSGVTISSAPNMTQQQVHFGAIPGAVVRLPAGVTHQQLQMMSDEERQRFLEQLHRTQIQAQRGKPRPGKPISAVQYKTAPPSTLRYPSTVVRATQSTTPGVNQPQSPQASNNWPPSSAQQSQVHPGAVAGTVSGAPNTNYGQGKIRMQIPITTVQGWQSTVQTPGTISRVLVGQSGWQQQPPVQQIPTGQPQQQQLQTTQGLLPQQLQQLHAQQLRQHFPTLTQQEAQQLIQTIPTHLREMQARDNSGRYDYLTQLEPKERQVVNHFYLRRHQQQLLQQRQQQLQAQQQAQLKIGTPHQSPNSWQQQSPQAPQPGTQYVGVSAHARPIPGRPLPPGYVGQPVVSPGQSSPHMVQGGQLTPHVSPLASPHAHSPIQRPENGSIVPHPALQGSNAAQNLVNQQNLVNPKTKTALANLLTNRLSGTVHQGAVITQGSQGAIEVPTHIVHKQRIPSEGVQVVGPGGEQVVVYQRQTLANITGSLANNLARPTSLNGTSAALYSRTGQVNQPGSSPVMSSPAAHYPTRPHFHGHDINTMLPRELCMVGCVFYIADYYSDIAPETLNIWKIVIQQHGGEVVNLYDSVRVTHVLCQHQKSPVFQQAVRENKRCITIYWVNDILIRGKMAPPWQAIHLPTPFGTNDKPMKDMLVSISGFEKEERSAIKIMLLLAGAKYTGYFSKHNHLLICKKFEGPKINKARDWKKSVVNGAWLSEVLLGQNTPPLLYLGTRYQHYLDDPLRIDPSLASHLFNAWKLPISVSKESVEKAKAVRELALRKRKSDNDGDQDAKRTHLLPFALSLESQLDNEKSSETRVMDSSVEQASKSIKQEEISPAQLQQPKIALSNVKNKDEWEKKILALGGTLARTNADMTHLVMGVAENALRTVKLLCAISCTSYIVGVRWLHDSHVHQKFIDEETYKLKMPEFENIFNFSLQQTLLRKKRKELFTGKHFYMTPSVLPGRSWLKEIIECAGGAVDDKRKSLNYIKEANKDEKHQYICLAHEADEHLVKDIIQEGINVYNSEFVMASILTQEMDYASGMFHLSCIKEE